MTARRARTTWWRRERLALVLLPIAIVTAFVASSSRVDDYWWSRGFHQEADRTAAGVATIDDEYDDGTLRYDIKAKIALESARPITSVKGSDRPVGSPTGTRVWEVRLRWDADPQVPLVGCKIALYSSSGAQYLASSLGFDPNGITPIQDCVPDETTGPKPTLDGTEPEQPEGEAARPQTYSTRVYVVVPNDVEPTAVRIWWFLPRYAELPIG